MRYFNAPVPIIAGVTFPQIDPDLLRGIPEWVISLGVILWVMVSIAEKFDKLPGEGKNRRKDVFKEKDRKMLGNLNALLSTREKGGIERFLLMNQRQEELYELMEKLVHLQEQQTDHLKVMSEAIQRIA